jgi:pimeloyl-ACP methyl ester carboxylesterase
MKDRKWLRTLLICSGCLAFLYAVAAIVLIHCPEPAFTAPPFVSVSNAENKMILDLLRQDYEFQEHRFTMRDGKDLYARHYDAETDVTAILIHGMRDSSLIHNTSCGMIRAAAQAEIFAIDLRGHGESAGRPGDIDYIGQYEDDVSDIVSQVRARKPQGKLILAGHSMGGGIALRYAMKSDPSGVDGYLLFAPHLGFNSPTANPPKQDSDGEFGEANFKLHFPRLVGLLLLDIIGIDRFNKLPIAFFNTAAESSESGLGQYTFRAFSSVAPPDYRAALMAVDKPLFVVVGSNDEAFYSEHFQPAVSEYSDGKVLLAEGLNHSNIMFDEKVVAAVGEWINTL